jgi:V/A-type H+-transporting ATPase subunit I
MAIVPLSKATLYGPAAEKDAVLNDLQRLGCLHLNDLHPATARVTTEAREGTEAREALQYLEDSPVRRHPAGGRPSFDLPTLVKETLQIRDRSHLLDEERQRLQAHAAELEPWGDFTLPEWAKDGALRFWFYTVPLRRVEQLQSLDVPWRVVGRDHRFAYVVACFQDPPAEMPGISVMLDPRPLSEVRAKLSDVERELEELDYKRIGLTLHVAALRGALDEADDRAARDQAGRVSLEQDGVFAVQGWVPTKQVEALRKYSADHRLALTLEAPGPKESPPTLLDNAKALRGGEGMVTFYKTPSYQMWDPSKAVFFAFAAFFGMIFSDAGYGLLIGLFTVAFWKRLGRSQSGLRGLLVALAISSVVYGILVGSYFGVVPPPGSWLSRLHLLDAENSGLMMTISVAVGVTHLSLANLITAWRRRRSVSLLGSVGWTAVLWGGLGAGLASSRPQLMRLGLAVVAFGLLLVLLFSSEHPFSVAPKALLSRFLEGLKSLTEVSKVFGDVLSYLRLFALGLAAIKLAEAFNHLAASSFALKGVGMVLGILILVIGHAINLVMGIMGGVVHGLRLNVIEFFNWSLPEEGALYRAFSRKAA